MRHPAQGSCDGKDASGIAVSLKPPGGTVADPLVRLHGMRNDVGKPATELRHSLSLGARLLGGTSRDAACSVARVGPATLPAQSSLSASIDSKEG
jgi:hypothetical protein